MRVKEVGPHRLQVLSKRAVGLVPVMDGQKISVVRNDWTSTASRKRQQAKTNITPRNTRTEYMYYRLHVLLPRSVLVQSVTSVISLNWKRHTLLKVQSGLKNLTRSTEALGQRVWNYFLMTRGKLTTTFRRTVPPVVPPVVRAQLLNVNHTYIQHHF